MNIEFWQSQQVVNPIGNDKIVAWSNEAGNKYYFRNVTKNIQSKKFTILPFGRKISLKSERLKNISAHIYGVRKTAFIIKTEKEIEQI